MELKKFSELGKFENGEWVSNKSVDETTIKKNIQSLENKIEKVKMENMVRYDKMDQKDLIIQIMVTLDELTTDIGLIRIELGIPKA